MNRTLTNITEGELARRLQSDAATWRIVPPADLHRRTMRTIADHEHAAATGPMHDSMRRAAALLAACLLLAATSLLAIRLQAPAGGRQMTGTTLEEFRAAVDQAEAHVEQARGLMAESSLQQELAALATDVESLTTSMYRRVAWLDLRQN